MEQLVFEAIGTGWQVTVPGGIDAALQAAIHARIVQFDAVYSRFRNDSLVAEIARHAGTYTFPPDAKQLFAVYRAMYDATGGQMTPLVGNLLVDTGYDAKYSLTPKETLRPVPKWDDVMRYEHPVLTTQVPVLLDFGAAGKGYLIDIVSELIEAAGHASYTVNAGGDIRYRGELPLRVGLEDPDNTAQVIGVAPVGNMSICASAGTRRRWRQYHHIMDPTTQTSPMHLSAVWVIAEMTILADALTTALFFASPAALMQRFSFEYAVLHSDRRIEKSRGFPGEMFTV